MTNQDMYIEWLRGVKRNREHMLEVHKLVRTKGELQAKQAKLPLCDKVVSDSTSGGPLGVVAKKRIRRTAMEIERRFRCPVIDCNKGYGTEATLLQHIRRKHPGYQESGAMLARSNSSPPHQPSASVVGVAPLAGTAVGRGFLPGDCGTRRPPSPSSPTNHANAGGGGGGGDQSPSQSRHARCNPYGMLPLSSSGNARPGASPFLPGGLVLRGALPTSSSLAASACHLPSAKQGSAASASGCHPRDEDSQGGQSQSPTFNCTTTASTAATANSPNSSNSSSQLHHQHSQFQAALSSSCGLSASSSPHHHHNAHSSSSLDSAAGNDLAFFSSQPTSGGSGSSLSPAAPQDSFFNVVGEEQDLLLSNAAAAAAAGEYLLHHHHDDDGTGLLDFPSAHRHHHHHSSTATGGGSTERLLRSHPSGVDGSTSSSSSNSSSINNNNNNNNMVLMSSCAPTKPLSSQQHHHRLAYALPSTFSSSHSSSPTSPSPRQPGGAIAIDWSQGPSSNLRPLSPAGGVVVAGVRPGVSPSSPGMGIGMYAAASSLPGGHHCLSDQLMTSSDAHLDGSSSSIPMSMMPPPDGMMIGGGGGGDTEVDSFFARVSHQSQRLRELCVDDDETHLRSQSRESDSHSSGGEESEGSDRSGDESSGDDNLPPADHHEDDGPCHRRLGSAHESAHRNPSSSTPPLLHQSSDDDNERPTDSTRQLDDTMAAAAADDGTGGGGGGGVGGGSNSNSARHPSAAADGEGGEGGGGDGGDGDGELIAPSSKKRRVGANGDGRSLCLPRPAAVPATTATAGADCPAGGGGTITEATTIEAAADGVGDATAAAAAAAATSGTCAGGDDWRHESSSPTSSSVIDNNNNNNNNNFVAVESTTSPITDPKSSNLAAYM
eukprot:GHVU01040760.1.p1 GENE.GHVU01040760.1~~GHVU01040760.1.p1  ORF type:complete len:887 (+),score=214.24 GHVU01040760.1:1-2661(+)